MPPLPEVTVVMGCHTMHRWDAILAAIASTRQQDPPPRAIVVSVDHNSELLARLQGECLPGVTFLANTGSRGASGTRNTGARVAETEIIVFLDDDACPHPGWLAALVEPFADPAVVGTGGWVLPTWHTGEPVWFPPEFGWLVGASYRGMPGDGPIRNVWAENMAVRATVFGAVGGFREDFGKVGNYSRPEDTDLCIRMALASGGRWQHVTRAVVDHQVPADRATYGFFVRRNYLEGRGKVELARLLGAGQALDVEASYLTRTLPRAVLSGVVDSWRARSLTGLRRSGAIITGVIAAGFGAGVGTVARLRRPQL